MKRLPILLLCATALYLPSTQGKATSTDGLYADKGHIVAEWFSDNTKTGFDGTTITVSDATGKYVGTMEGDAHVRTIGGPEHGYINVLDFGDNSGYFDLGTDIGKAVYGLTDYTIAAYFRIADDNTSLNGPGNFIWNFSNSDDINTGLNGCMIGNLTDQSHSIARTNWRDNQNVCYNRKAAKGAWHHYAFTQQGHVGTLYVDGRQVAQNTNFSYLPSTILPIKGREGTLYNWLGRSCYAGDNQLNKTLLYDFTLLDTALSAEELGKVKTVIERLNAAYAENAKTSTTDFTASLNDLTLGDLSNVCSDLTLPAVSAADTTVHIYWTSSHPNIISTNGSVFRLEHTDAHVVLVATLMKDGQTATKVFRAYVPATDTVWKERPRVIVTTDGEADDKASMVRFLLSSDEFDVEAIVNSCSQFHWTGGTGWNAFQPVGWVKDYAKLYGQVYDNLLGHDPYYPSPDYLVNRWRVGNVDKVGEYQTRTEGAKLIAGILLDDTDKRPIWLQAWGGCNTFAAALKIIEDDYPDRMEEVAGKIRFYLIWEQDDSYQKYIRGSWEKYNIPTIIADQFDCMAYIWPKVLPEEAKAYLEASFVKPMILTDKGPLCAVYTNNDGAYNAEGDTPSFLHCINNGLRNMESPGYGGWGGRYVRVRGNVWMDTPPTSAYSHPTGQYGYSNSWSKMMENWSSSSQTAIRDNYFRPLWRWIPDIQNDFAARATWCVKSYAEANHHPKASLDTPLDLSAQPGQTMHLDASQSSDPDGDSLLFHWYAYPEAGTYNGTGIANTELGTTPAVSFTIPNDAKQGQTIHLVCEVADNGMPTLKSYLRVIITIDGTTSIASVPDNKPTACYNLNGQKVNRPQKQGIYIVNKSKVVIN